MAVTQKALTCFPLRHFISPHWGKSLSLSLWSDTQACILSPLHAVCCILPPIVTRLSEALHSLVVASRTSHWVVLFCSFFEFKRSKFLTHRAASLNFEWISNHLIKWYKHLLLLQLVQVIKHSRATLQRTVEHTVKHYSSFLPFQLFSVPLGPAAEEMIRKEKGKLAEANGGGRGWHLA